ncbi:glycosyltransferase family 4 protein [Cognatishimia sp. MH4019]|uniref:glycosyltransferase family 4 protein n=1 Tax=Cognatishimia sp. MH4019 TaxID=2854030 RepID=UPI001CD6CC1B|nr:glycosyltransferase family 4 protein [Cognatishimia sp. MH4019]
MNILVAHADLSARGGAEAYAQALIARLRAAGHRVGVLDINGLQSGNQHHQPTLLRLGTLTILRRLSLFKYALVCRVLPRLAQAFDAVILSYGEGPDTGRPTLRILHAPALFSAHPKLLRLLGARAPFWPRQLYALTCRALARPVDNPAQTHTLANSRWTARIAARAHGIAHPDTLYPKVHAHTNARRKRDPHALLSIGRIVPNKRIEDAIAVTEALRARDLPATLTILGRADSRYARRLIRQHQHKPYLRFLANASDAQLREALATARIGLHFYRHEHFGIAVAEMITAGLTPLVYEGGGVRELVPDRTLRFRTIAQATDRAAALLMDAEPKATADLQNSDALSRALSFDAQANRALTPFLRSL